MRRSSPSRPDRIRSRITWRRVIAVVLVLIAAGAARAAYLLIFKGYVWPEWTGFAEFIDPSGEYHPAKTLWDWLDLLIIPLVLAVGALLFNRAERRAEREIARQRDQTERYLSRDRIQENALQAYLDRMTELLLDEGLRASDSGSEVRAVARSRTLTTLRVLDGTRKGILLRFLFESKLIDKDELVVDLRGANLEGADLLTAYLIHTDLSEANLTGADLRWADLSKANLIETNLLEADLRWAHLRWTYLGGANLRRANLSRARLRGADLSGANLNGANLRRANLNGANLSGAVLNRAVLNGTDLTKAKYDSQTKWPEGFDSANSGAIGPKANLRGADLSGAILIRADLSGADLNGADLSGAALNEADLSATDLGDAKLIRADLREAVLREAILSGANLTFANLRGCHLSGTYMDGTNLSGSNLREADLRRASLRGADLTEAIYNSQTQWPEGFDYKNSEAFERE